MTTVNAQLHKLKIKSHEENKDQIKKETKKEKNNELHDKEENKKKKEAVTKTDEKEKEKENQNLKNENEKLKETISSLQQEKNNIKKKLMDEINNLKETIELLKQENKNMKQKFMKEIEKLKEKIQLQEKEIAQKNRELEKILSQNNNLTDNMISITKPGEKIIAVNFVTMVNQDIINYCLPCKLTDLFVRLEEKLYNDYPKYKNYETYFVVNTRRIKRFKTIEENNIKGNDVITLFVNE